MYIRLHPGPVTCIEHGRIADPQETRRDALLFALAHIENVHGKDTTELEAVLFREDVTPDV